MMSAFSQFERVLDFVNGMVAPYILCHSGTINVTAALRHIDDCGKYCDDPELNYGNLKSLQKYLDEMFTYIRNNKMMIPNYGEMHRYGEPVSTVFMESTFNEVIARRMAKKQRMQWRRKGAHYLLQTPTVVLNNELQDKFSCWYPGCAIDDQNGGKLSAIASIAHYYPTLFHDLVPITASSARAESPKPFHVILRSP